MKFIPRAFFCGLAGLLVSGAIQTATAELHVSTDFEGGSARNVKIDQEARVIQLMPGGDPQRGWACWWYARIDGVPKDAPFTLVVSPSDLPTRNNGKDTGKPLDAAWCLPVRAAVSNDASTWRHTDPGKRDGKAIHYTLRGTGDPLWVAWGPPFTPKDADAMIAAAEQSLPVAKPFELARTREGRTVRGLRVGAGEGEKPGVWVQARQHAWESGASWVARGFVEWLTGDEAGARWLRDHAEVVVVPIMDVDNVATGNGGKEAAPRDHNRDWDSRPVYPEVAAAQTHLRAWAAENRLDLFLDLHNPGAADLQPFFFVGPEELLSEAGRQNRARLLQFARERIANPLELADTPRVTGPGYHPLWRQISGQWVNANGNPHTVAACLETAWNTPHSTVEGYRTVGTQLGRAVADCLRTRPPQ